MNALKDLLTRFGRTFTAYAGDEALMQAGISAAANVIVADGEVAGDEFETALVGLRDPRAPARRPQGRPEPQASRMPGRMIEANTGTGFAEKRDARTAYQVELGV